MVAPMIGGALAAPVYWFIIEGNHSPKDDSERGEGSINPQLSYKS